MAKKYIIIGKNGYKILYDEKIILSKIDFIAKKIFKRHKKDKQPPILLLILTGGLYFGVDLSRTLEKLGLNHQLDTMGLKRYLKDEQGGTVEITSRPRADLNGRNVIIVEDVIDDGQTMNFLNCYLKKITRPPASIEYCALCIKKNHKPLDFKINYKGFSIEPNWIVGYGLDANQNHRGLKDIYIKTN